MNPKDYLCYCGLYCRLCSNVSVIPPQSRALLATLEHAGFGDWGDQMFEGFASFWEILQKLAKQDETCTLCQGDCGDPGCVMRPCARERGVEVCALCDEYPCDKVTAFMDRYAEVKINNDRIREVGLDAWLEEQEELVRQGKFYGSGS